MHVNDAELVSTWCSLHLLSSERVDKGWKTRYTSFGKYSFIICFVTYLRTGR